MASAWRRRTGWSATAWPSRTSLAAAGRSLCSSGGSEAIHTALVGCAGSLEPGRVLLSAVEHPASYAAAAALVRRGWRLQFLPVDRRGVVDLEALQALLQFINTGLGRFHPI